MAGLMATLLLLAQPTATLQALVRFRCSCCCCYLFGCWCALFTTKWQLLGGWLAGLLVRDPCCESAQTTQHDNQQQARQAGTR